MITKTRPITSILIRMPGFCWLTSGFLAWIRTALAVLAGGIALTKLGHGSTNQNIIGVTVTILGGLMATVGYIRFKSADRAIRQGKLPSTGLEPLIQAGGIIAVALALVITHLLGVW